MITISELFIYPIKSCAGTAVESFELDRFGPTHDRRWMLVDEQGLLITQREVARMALIKPALTESGLRITYHDQLIDVDTPVSGEPKAVQVWADRVQAYDAGRAASDFFSRVLERTASLVWMPETTERQVKHSSASAAETVGFADAFPLLLISQASLDDLNSRLDQPVPMNRFRPNIVVQGCDAFAEDSWSKLTSENSVLNVVEPCSRCVMPSINQATAEKNSAILRVLASYRRGEDGKTYFGQNLLYQGSARLSVGQVFTPQ
ncbi:MAG: MOSC N-terminal beta barrel domain-containing protein [Pseudomonadota bacterium]